MPTHPVSRWEKAKRCFWVGVGAVATFKLFDGGLARFLGLETLTHGTGPLGYVGINRNGADPNWGGDKTGSSSASGNQGFVERSKRYFHVFKDSELGTDPKHGPIEDSMQGQYWAHLACPRLHAILSGMSNFGYNPEKPDRLSAVAGAIAGGLTPTLKFRLRPEDVLNCADQCRFEQDPDYSAMAYRTPRAIPASHLGLRGTLTQGLDSNTPYRMASNPLKVLRGAVLLAAAYHVGKATYNYFKNPPIPPEKKEKTTWGETAKKTANAVIWGSAALIALTI